MVARQLELEIQIGNWEHPMGKGFDNILMMRKQKWEKSRDKNNNTWEESNCRRFIVSCPCSGHDVLFMSDCYIKSHLVCSLYNVFVSCKTYM